MMIGLYEKEKLCILDESFNLCYLFNLRELLTGVVDILLNKDKYNVSGMYCCMKCTLDRIIYPL